MTDYDETVRGEDWYGRDLGRETFTKVAFIDVDFTEATTEGTIFEECSFTNVKFNVSTHTDSAFVNCTFRGCNFFDATFTRSGFCRSSPCTIQAPRAGALLLIA